GPRRLPGGARQGSPPGRRAGSQGAMALPVDARRPRGRPLRSCLLLWLRPSPTPGGPPSALPAAPAPERASRPSRPHRLHRPADLRGEGGGNGSFPRGGATAPLRRMNHPPRGGRPVSRPPGGGAPPPRRGPVGRRATKLAPPPPSREGRDPAEDRLASHYG